MAINVDCHTRTLADFVAALREQRRPALDGLEGRKAVAIVTACYESARKGRAAQGRGKGRTGKAGALHSERSQRTHVPGTLAA